MKGHILVLDDELGLLEIFADVLSEAGHEVETASDPLGALARVARGGIDTVVSDINMPGITGIELLRRVRDHDPDLPVVLVTGNPTLETAIQALEHGAVQYLVKPVTSGALEAAVERALKLRRLSLLRREALAYLRGQEAPGPERLSLGSNLSRALQSLWMAYQPIVRSGDGSLYGHEALLRSNEPSLPHPGAVLAAAEQLGRLPEVGRAVRGCVAELLEHRGAPGCAFVNLHALDLEDETLFSEAAPLSRHAANVVLEITERASFEAIPDARARIRALRQLGFRIALDDLGAGYAGLTSFAALEPDVVKLDIALVRGANGEPVKQKLIRSVCELCHDLGILAVAEGIETTADRDTVVELGCDLLQGYLIARPEAAPLRDGSKAARWPARVAARR